MVNVTFALALRYVPDDCVPKDLSSKECVKDTNIIVFPGDDMYSSKLNRLESHQYLERVKLFYRALVSVN